MKEKEMTTTGLETSKKPMNVKMERINGDELPLVEVEFLLKDGKTKKGLMILDSGCVQSIIFNDVVKKLQEECIMSNIHVNVHGMAGDAKVQHCAEVAFTLGGETFHEVMVAHDEPYIGTVDDTPILGILGNVFFMNNNLVIDFSDLTLHTSVVNHSNFCIGDSSYFFSMEYMKYYGVPVLVFVNNGEEIVALADTGSTVNVITEKALNRVGLKADLQDTTVTLDNIGRTEDAQIASVTVDIANVRNNSVIEPEKYAGRFAISKSDNVLPGNVWGKKADVDSTGSPTEEIPDIEAIISCPVMAQKGWVLDFGAMIIYKRKEGTTDGLCKQVSAA